MFDGLGGINADGLRLACQTMAIPPDRQAAFIRQLTIFLTAFHKARHEQQNNNRAAEQG